jgi:AcrR family transcriptional regulator/DNA-binding MarR family transcriptional regulator
MSVVVAKDAVDVRVGFVRGQVAELQRARIITAMVEVIGEKGYADASIAHVVSRSGVSRRTFYEQFSDREDCFLAALDDTILRAGNRAIPLFEAEHDWSERVRAGLIGLLRFIEEEPGRARFLILDSLSVGPRALERRRQVTGKLARVIEQGAIPDAKKNRTPKPRSKPVGLTGEGVVGAVLAVLHARILGKEHDLMGLVGQLMGMIVLPYEGPAAVARETERPIPKPSDHKHQDALEELGSADPLLGLQMRLTYRTIRVLLEIGSQPGASNREIGTAAGIEDQGQISKLLARLARLGLIQNTGLGHRTGAPNQWTLTLKGQHLQGTIHKQTSNL